jgi:hypothetical protein
MRCGVLTGLLLLAINSSAQLDLPVSILLDGAGPDQRQVTGLASPTDSSAGVSLEVARSRALITGTSIGTTTLIVALNPPVSTITAGFEITIIPTAAHAAGPNLVLNASGPYAIIQQNGLPLDSAQLPVGRPARLMFNGTQFQLVSGAARPCPTGYSATTHRLCIEDSSRTGVNFRTAANTCSTAGGRLCSINDWVVACHRLTNFLGSVVELEWVDNASNSQDQAKLVGVDRTTQAIGCDFGDTDVHTSQHRYRCCFDR